jgi:hypothetical protein
MTETELPLTEQYSMPFTADGEAIIGPVGPGRPFERWEIRSTQVSSDSITQSKVIVYSDSALNRIVEGSYSGNLDTSNTVFKLAQGASLYFKWTGGSPLAMARLSIDGSKFVARR